MSNIVVLGAGVMGSALCVPASDKQRNKVTLVGSPLDDSIIRELKSSREHPTLNVSLPDSMDALTLSEIDPGLLRKADVIIIGVSSPGIEWVCDLLEKSKARPSLLALITKGLVKPDNPEAVPLTYADALNSYLTEQADSLVGIGGPCIARELALRIPTRVTFASRDIIHAESLRSTLQTDYYSITTHNNIVAVEACAALKNFLCIGVSAMLTAYPLGDSHAKNPVAALYNQAVLELLILSRWISKDSPGNAKTSDVAFDLAGMGDLHVTVGGGRNSRLGSYLGKGSRLEDLMSNELEGVTVEGVDTGRNLYSGFTHACKTGVLDEKRLPLTSSILQTIVHNSPFNFDFNTLPT